MPCDLPRGADRWGAKEFVPSVAGRSFMPRPRKGGREPEVESGSRWKGERKKRGRFCELSPEASPFSSQKIFDNALF